MIGNSRSIDMTLSTFGAALLATLFSQAVSLPKAHASYPSLPSLGCPVRNQFGYNHFHELTPMNSCGNAAVDELSTRVLRGGAPNKAGISCLAKQGALAIIDLRSEGEQGQESKWAAAAGLSYYPFPMTTDSSVPSKSCKSAGLNAQACNNRSATQAVARILEILKDHPNGDVYVHCARGEDRTGLVIGLFRLLGSACPASAARKEMLDFYYTPYSQLEGVWKAYR